MRSKPRAFIFLITLFVGAITVLFFISSFDLSATDKVPIPPSADIVKVQPESEIRFNIIIDSFKVEDNVIKKNEFLSAILDRYSVDPATVSTIVKKSKPIFDVRKMSVGRPYTVFTEKDRPNQLAYFVYRPNAIDYIVYDLRDSVQVYAAKKEVTTEVKTVFGEINNSLYQALQESGSDPAIAGPLSEIFGGVVNFYSIQEGDWFRIQYESQYVKEQAVGQGRIQSAIFSHRGKEFQAYYFQPEGSTTGEYYDENGNSLRRTFLKAPLKFSRISSRYSARRLHPVQKVWKAHLGTDYAAPHGTPIVATADGVVTESQFNRGNGNYVKVKHNKKYTTQYLHMSKRAVKRGQRVQQGQVIGYVGSTGLATGPHVCYRFWENGRQVDALKKNFQASIPLENKYKPEFKEVVRVKQLQLANIGIEPLKEEVEYTAYQDGPPDLFKYFGKL